MKALISGAGGFIGGELASTLIQSGWEVRILTSQPRSSLTKRFPECQIFEGVLGKDHFATYCHSVEGCDVVFHAAAIRNRWGTPPAEYRAVNVQGTEDLLMACCATQGVGRFVYVSSVGVYGYPGCVGINEDFPIPKFSRNDDYHSSKADAEELVYKFMDRIDATIIRPTITYGRGDTNGMVTRLVSLIAAKRWIQIGKGENFIHLIYIDDLIQGLIQAGTHPAAVNQRMILSGSEPIKFRDLVRLIAQKINIRLSSFSIPTPVALAAGQLSETLLKVFPAPFQKIGIHSPLITKNMVETICKNRSFSSEKAARLMDFRAITSYEKGIEQTIQWMAKTGKLDTRNGQLSVKTNL